MSDPEDHLVPVTLMVTPELAKQLETDRAKGEAVYMLTMLTASKAWEYLKELDERVEQAKSASA